MRALSGLIRGRHSGTAAVPMAFAILLACGMAAPAHAQQSAPAASSETKSQADNDRQKPSSPQSNMGRIDTQSGGAPASSPQGDSPPGMQPVPSAPDTTSRPKRRGGWLKPRFRLFQTTFAPRSWWGEERASMGKPRFGHKIAVGRYRPVRKLGHVVLGFLDDRAAHCEEAHDPTAFEEGRIKAEASKRIDAL